MKKSKVRVMSVCAAIAVIAAMFTGCANPSLGSSQDTLKPGNTQQTTNQTTSDTEAVTTEPQEGKAPAAKTQGTINFVIGDDGKIVGSPSDYGIEFDINGLKFTAAEYESDMDTYVNTLYDLLADDAPYKEDRINSYTDKAQTLLKYVPELGLAREVTFSASAHSSCISYGAQGDHPNSTSMVDFKMNDIKLGDNIEKAMELYGEPCWAYDAPCYTHWNGPDEEPTDGCENHYYYYYFEDSSHLEISTVGDGEIIALKLQYPDI